MRQLSVSHTQFWPVVPSAVLRSRCKKWVSGEIFGSSWPDGSDNLLRDRGADDLDLSSQKHLTSALNSATAWSGVSEI